MNFFFECPECDKGTVPLIQMASTNKIESESEVKYAIEHDRKRFLLVSEISEENSDYRKNLMKDFRDALETYGYQGQSR
jgi:hypothetical protein